jgi:hypothetical protein
MRTLVTKTDVYKFHELSEDAQETVIAKYYDINIYDEWHEFVIDMMKDAGAMIGIDISDIYYRGFWSQGDGACFHGTYEYRKGGYKRVVKEFPEWKELHAIAKGLQEIQRKHFYQLSAKVGRGYNANLYSHENTTSIRVYDMYGETNNESVCELLRDFMRLIYSTLKKEYEYLTSEETIIETIESNEYEFTENGE